MKLKYIKPILALGCILALGLTACGAQTDATSGAAVKQDNNSETAVESEETQSEELSEDAAELSAEEENMEEPEIIVEEPKEPESIMWDESWEYASYSVIHTDPATMYYAQDGNGITVCVNAGHGTRGGDSVMTQCHPDGTPKVTGGSTAAGAVMATANSSGMQFADGTPEAQVTLACALAFRDELLSRGYNVLMIRDGEDAQLDNIARTVMANNNADCHIALHWDSSESDKGAFYIAVPDGTYKEMEPVRSHWEEHDALGSALLTGLQDKGVKIFSNGSMQIDLTQTSYSTVPSVDMELGDKISDHSEATLEMLAVGLADGVDLYFQ